MGILYDSLTQERDELIRWLDFWNVPTRKREDKERRLYEVHQHMHVLRRAEDDIKNGNDKKV